MEDQGVTQQEPTNVAGQICPQTGAQQTCEKVQSDSASEMHRTEQTLAVGVAALRRGQGLSVHVRDHNGQTGITCLDTAVLTCDMLVSRHGLKAARLNMFRSLSLVHPGRGGGGGREAVQEKFCCSLFSHDKFCVNSGKKGGK